MGARRVAEYPIADFLWSLEPLKRLLLLITPPIDKARILAAELLHIVGQMRQQFLIDAILKASERVHVAAFGRAQGGVDLLARLSQFIQSRRFLFGFWRLLVAKQPGEVFALIGRHHRELFGADRLNRRLGSFWRVSLQLGKKRLRLWRGRDQVAPYPLCVLSQFARRRFGDGVI